MKRRVLFAVLAAATLAASGCDYFVGKSWTFRQKLTLSVATPDGVKTGSSVTQWKFQKGPGIASSLGGMGSFQNGEAVAVELAPGKYVFALLGKPHPVLSFWKQEEIGATIEDELDTLSSSILSGPVPRSEYPMLVTFADIGDPKTVKEVKPGEFSDVFGPGYRFDSITLETTQEKATKGEVEKVLGWLSQYPEPPVLPDVKPNDFSVEAQLRHGDFIRR